MRASLVSATSLLALLLLGQVPAGATPAATPGDAGASPSTEFDNATVGSLVTEVDSIALSRTLSGNMGPSNPGLTLGVSATSMGLTAPGFPPSNDSIGNSFVRDRGAVPPAVTSIGDRGANEPHGWHGSSNSVFVESAKSFWLNGSSNSPGGSVSPAISDTYAPAVRGVPASATVASTTLGRSYTPLSRTAAPPMGGLLSGDGGFGNDDAGLANQAVSSVFARRRGAPLASNGAAGTAADELGGPAHSRIAFGTAGYGKLLTVYQRLANAGTGVANNRAVQTVESFSTAAPTTPSLSSALAVPSLSHAGSQVVMPMTASTAQGTAVLNSSMTIFTDQSAALSGTGDTVTYTLAGFAVAAPASAPEPASLAMLGAGLAGMVSFLRRRQRMVCR